MSLGKASLASAWRPREYYDRKVHNVNEDLSTYEKQYYPYDQVATSGRGTTLTKLSPKQLLSIVLVKDTELNVGEFDEYSHHQKEFEGSAQS